jgi:hypothetical protein
MTPDDETHDVFDYGDRTIFRLRTQDFEIEHDYGTMILPVSALPEAESETLSEDPIARLEQRLDLVLRHLAALQQRVDSIDATLERLVNR